jgi:acetyl/propionyl-CoA carboxylase alpha subunit
LLYGESSLKVDYVRRRDGTFDLDDLGHALIHDWSDEYIDVEINARRRRARVTHARGHLYVQSLHGTVDFEIVERFEVRRQELQSGGLSAPMPGKVLDVRVTPGQQVHVGETLIVLEAMKMEHVISASADGTVDEVLVAKDDQVESGAALLTMRPESENESA